MKGITIIILTFLMNLGCYGQISNYIYALNNTAVGVYYFSKIEISTGAITNFQLATSYYGNEFSSCINNHTQKYYLCTGPALKTFDPVSGNLLSTVTLPIPATAAFLHIQYNPCDSNIYGIINDYPTNIFFARFNPNNGTMTNISNFPNTGYCFGCTSILDPDSGIFTFTNGNIIGVNIYSGQIIYNTPIINLPNEYFNHISLKCSTHQIFGTSGNINAGIKYLSTINPYSGIVTHVSNPGWSVGVWKPAAGGNFINQSTGDYYYSGVPHVIVGANTVTGNVIYNQSINSGDLFFIQHFSQCQCPSTGIHETLNPIEAADIYPNPFSDKLNIASNGNDDFEFILYDVAARIIFRQKFTKLVSLNTEQFEKGLYLYELKSKNKLHQKGKIVKE